VSQGKIEPLINAAEHRAITQIEILEARLELKIEQIQERLRKLEEGVSPSLNDRG
jgi:hypothetical protein